MTCYTDFYIRYCPSCGKRLDAEAQEFWPQDALQGFTVTCTCGTICHYFPEHRFPYIEPPEPELVA